MLIVPARCTYMHERLPQADRLGPWGFRRAHTTCAHGDVKSECGRLCEPLANDWTNYVDATQCVPGVKARGANLLSDPRVSMRVWLRVSASPRGGYGGLTCGADFAFAPMRSLLVAGPVLLRLFVP